jgi:hypothetical protein
VRVATVLFELGLRPVEVEAGVALDEHRDGEPAGGPVTYPYYVLRSRYASPTDRQIQRAEDAESLPLIVHRRFMSGRLLTSRL